MYEKITAKTNSKAQFSNYNLLEKVCWFKKSFINLQSANE